MKKLNYMLYVILCCLLAACSNTFEQKTSETVADSKVRVDLSFGNGSRTVMPGYDLTKLTDIVIQGDLTGDVKSHFKLTFAKYDDAVSKGMIVEKGTWDFSVNAKIGNVAFTGFIENKLISESDNTLNFVMQVSSLGGTDNTGSISVTLTFPADSGVAGVQAGLYQIADDSQVEGMELKSLRVRNNSVTYTDSNVPVGNYRFKVFLYADETYMSVINTYRELVTVAADLTSTAERTLDSLNEVYKIEYEANGGTLSNAYIVPEVYTRSSEFTLATAEYMTKDGYAFVGWYESEDCTSERVTQIVKGNSGDKKFYAKWAVGEVVTQSNIGSLNLSSVTDGYTLAICRDVDLSVLAAKLKTAANKVCIDLFASSVTSLPDSVFMGCKQLSGVVLPQNLTSIGDKTFYGCASLNDFYIPAQISSIGKNVFGKCSSLAALTIDSANECYEVKDGVLFTKGGLSLVQYPAGKTGNGYVIPDGTKNILSGAFQGNAHIETVTVCTSVSDIAPDAFNDCSKITNYIVNSSNTAYDDNNSSGIIYKGETLVRYPAGKTDATFTLPSWVTEIAPYAFYGCTSLETVQISSTSELVRIGSYAFAGCTLLTMSIPEKVTFIGGHAFDGCADMEYCSVDFNSNGGSTVESVCVKKGSAISVPADPTRRGYTFDGWYTNAGLTLQFSSTAPISQNTTLYAKWTLNSYTITYIISDGEGIGSDEYPLSYTIESETITLNPPTRTGYTFGGWYTSSSFTESSLTTQIQTGSVGNKVFYAKWTPITYTITYHISDKGILLNNAVTSYTIESETITLSEPTSDAYTFAGWYTSDKLTTPIAAIKAGSYGNVEVWAGWWKSTESTDSTVPVYWSRIYSGTSYYFYNSSGNLWQSSNYHMNSTTAASTWQITLSAEADVSIPYSVSSEKYYDKLTITLDEITIVDGISGTQSGTYRANLSAGTHTLRASYSKNYSSYSGSDRGYVTLDPVTCKYLLVY